MYNALFQTETEQALSMMARQPPPPRPTAGIFDGFWGSVLSAPAAAVLDLATTADRASGSRQQFDLRTQAERGGLPRLDRAAEAQRQTLERAVPVAPPIRLRSPIEEAVRESLTPDPITTGAASQAAFGIVNLLTKAGIFGGAGGAIFGAAATGVTEGGIESQKLQAQGVDSQTALAAGAVRAASTSIGLAAPIAGSTLLRSLGIVAATGPGTFMAEQSAIREILQRADYGKQAEQYDPTDITGLIVSTLAPAGFAAVVHGARAARARAVVPPEAVDAAQTLNLRQSVEQAAPVKNQADPVARQAHLAAVDQAEAQLARGEPVSPRSAVIDQEVAARVETRVADAIAAEVRALDSAYTRVLDNPVGAPDDPLVRLTSERIGEVVVERGPVWERGEADIEVGGYGLVKVIWKHGERSATPAEWQVTRADVLRLPDILKNFEPIRDSMTDKGNRVLEWQVEREDGKRVIYAVRGFVDDGRRHVVTVFVNEGRSAAYRNRPLSKMVGNLPRSSSGGSTPRPAAAGAGDTGPGSFSAIARPADQAGATESSVPRSAGESTPDPVRQAAAERPEAEVALFTDQEGKAVPLTAREALEQADAEFAQAQADTRAFDAAIACAIRTGDLE